MNKYYVIINKWDSTKNKVIEGNVIGEFDNFMSASLFANAYENYYSSSTKIVEMYIVRPADRETDNSKGV